MKVVHGGSNVLASQGVTQQAQFQIKANAQAFRILSSGLYSDKISAVLREIGCNAADAHIAQGTPDRPIEVKLPTRIDPSFYIKDFGPGLDNEEITGLFTTYFSSNKSETNDMTGAFGLGSKSPFSYTDSFSITSVKHGIKRSYTAHIGSDGAPVISLLAEEASSDDWMHGMMVSFPVRPEHFAEFDKKSKEVYRWFRIKPQVLGNALIGAAQFQIEGEGILLCLVGENTSSGSDEKARVLMGNVAYPLRSERVGKQSPAIDKLIRSGIHITLPIGSVMPTASREDLEYDEPSRVAIRTALDQAAKALCRKILAVALDPSLSEWVRHQHLRELARNMPYHLRHSVADLMNYCKVDATIAKTAVGLLNQEYVSLPSWVGNNLVKKNESKVASQAVVNQGDNSETVVSPDASNLFITSMYLQSDRTSSAVRRAVVAGRIAVGAHWQDAKISYTKRLFVLMADEGLYAHEKAKELIRSSDDVLILMDAGTSQAEANLQAACEKLALALGGVAIKRTSELPEPAEITARKALPKGVKAVIRPEVLHANAEVHYFDASKKKEFSRYQVEKVKLSTIPANGRFYLIGNKDMSTFKVDMPVGTRTMNHGELHKGLIAYRQLIAEGLPLTEIGGVVVLKAGELRTLQLREGGWKPLTKAMLASFKAPGVGDLIRARVNLMPELVSKTSYGVDTYSGILGLLVQAGVGKDKVWKAVAPMLKEFPRLEGVFAELIDAHAANGKAGLRVSLDAFSRVFPKAHFGFEDTRMTESQLKALVYAEHPMLKYVDGDSRTLRRQCDEDPKGFAEYLQHVLKVRGNV